MMKIKDFQHAKNRRFFSMKKFLYAFGVMVVLFLAGCQYGPLVPEDQYCIPTEKARELGLIEEEVPEEIIEIVPITEEIISEEEIVFEEELAEEEVGLPTKTVLEGELISFPNLATVDEDGDPIIYTFSEPLNENGEWQTAIGDEGEYVVTITASDGKTEVSQQVFLVVEGLNKAPVLEPMDDVVVNEGETITLSSVVADPDGDEVTVKYSGWMDSNEYTTTYQDAGEYVVTVTAMDATHEVSQEVMITVENVNRAPVLADIEDSEVTEGELVTVDYFATDLDDDELTYTFSELLDENGEWQTEEGDMGIYEASVVVSDGELTDTRTFLITVNTANQPPVLSGLQDIEVTLQNEDDTFLVVLEPEVSDPDGDEVIIDYAGWMTEATKEATWDDAGDNIVTITVTDGINIVEDVVVVSVNRAPQIFI